MRILKARLKQSVEVAAEINFDFQKDWLEASTIIERHKRQMISKIKDEMHKKIAEMTLEDIEFKILP